MESIQPKGQRDNKMYSVFQNNLSTILSNYMLFTCINMDLNYNIFQSGRMISAYIRLVVVNNINKNQFLRSYFLGNLTRR